MKKTIPQNKAIAILISLFLSQTLFAQQSPTYFGEIGSTISTGGQTPFWLRSNQYGIVPLHNALFSARIGMKADYDSTKKIKLGYGLELVGNTGQEIKLLIPEAYIKLKLGVFELYAGRRREIIGLADSTLSSGSYAWSGNALPIPKIQLSIPNYIPIGFTKGLFSIKGFFAHGWLDPNRSDVAGLLLHQKVFYTRIGKPNWPMKIHLGFTHQVQWAGQQLRGEKINFPVNLSSYWNVITGRSVNDTANIGTLGVNEGTNRLGNHLGTLEVGFEIQAKTFSLFLYRQSVYEDGSLAYLINIADGLNGISFQNKIKKRAGSFFHLKKIVAEVFYSKSQGGGDFKEQPYARGADNYFNNSIFTDGWSYYGRPIGTPFIPSYTDLQEGLTKPLIDASKPTEGYLFTNNNRVVVYHIGFSGEMSKDLAIEGKFSYSQNFGTYSTPFPLNTDQFSMILKAHKPVTWWKGASVIIALALDNGKLYQDNFGGYIGVRTALR